MFEVTQLKKKLFCSLFTTTLPSMPEDHTYNSEGIRLRYFGHGCVLVQTKFSSILFDPVISYTPQSNEIPRYTFADLPDHIDYVVITHNHQNHCMFETLLQLRYKVRLIVFPGNQMRILEGPSIKLILKHTGFLSLLELREMETITLEDGEIIALPFLGDHSDLKIQSKLSYGIELKGKKFLFAADSNNLEPTLYEHIFDTIGSIDMLFFAMECDGAPLSWLYGPLLSTPLKEPMIVTEHYMAKTKRKLGQLWKN